MSEETHSQTENDSSLSGDTIQTGNITGKGIAIGTGAQASYEEHHHYSDDRYDVHGLANPYLGLATFTYNERAKYAGRDTEIAEALAKMTNSSKQSVLLFVTGASGSGKSSFARAGVLPALKQYYAPGVEARIIEEVRPLQRPLDRLLDALQRRAGLPCHELNTAALPHALYTFLASHTPPHQVNLLVLDQFEELFSQSEPGQRDALFAILTNLPPFHVLRTHILATVRSDYLPELFQYQALYVQVKAGIELRAMTHANLRAAIQRPLQQHPDAKDKHFEPALLDTLAADAAQDAAYLPLLQVTLEKLWDDGVLKRSAYQSLTDAIKERAEDVYHTAQNGTRRPVEDQLAILALFLDLVEVSLDDDARHDVRRRRTIMTLTQDMSARRQLISELIDARLLSASRESRDGQDVEVVDIIHESLITNWQRLGDAIAARRQTLQQRKRFELALEEWEEHKRADTYLLDGVRLSEAQELESQGDVALRNPAAQDLFNHSVERREQIQQAELQRQIELAEAQRRRAVLFRQAFVVVALLLIVTAGAAWLAVDWQQVAQQNAQQAETNAAEANRQRQQVETNAAEARKERDRTAGLAVASAAQAELARNNIDLAYSLALAAIQMPQPALRAPSLLAEVVYTPGTIRTFQGHMGEVLSVAFSPDGKTALSSSSDETLRLWDVASGQTIRTFQDHTGEIYNLAFSSDGRTALSSSRGGTLRLWDVTNGQIIRTFQELHSAAFSPDGRTVLSGSDEGTLRLWDVASGQTIRTFQGVKRDVWSVAFSPDGTIALSGSNDGILQLWDVASGQNLRTFQGHSANVTSVVFSPDGKTALSGSSTDSTLRLWDVVSGQSLRVFQGHTSGVTSAAFSPDGATAFSASFDHTLRLWDVASGQTIGVFQGHTGAVLSVAFSPDGKAALSGSADKTLRLWDMASGQSIHTFHGHTNGVTSVAFSPDGKAALSGSWDTTLRLWDMASGQTIRTFQGLTGEVLSVAFSPDGKAALSGSTDKTLRLWDVTSGETIRTFQGITDDVWCVAFSPDGKTALSGSRDGTLRLWDVASGQGLRTLQGHASAIDAVAFSPDGKTVLSSSADMTLRLWDAASGETIRTFQGLTERATGVAFSPDGKTALSGSYDHILRLWDVASGQTIRTFQGHIGEVYSVAFSPDGATALSSSDDKTLRLWDVASGETIRTFQGYTGAVLSVAFSPDGTTALSGSSDGTLRLWKLIPIPYAGQVAWLCHNRYVPDLSPAQRQQYGIPADLVLCPKK